MRKLNCIIVDDEPIALDLVESYVMKTPFLQLKGKCGSVFEALGLIGNEQIDLVFLDIQMPEMNGIAFGQALPAGTKIIFTTAFKDYALDGFRVNAIDYLLKPFNYAEFLRASNRALEWFDLHEGRKEPGGARFMFVKSDYKQVKIDFDDVYYFEGLKDYVKIRLASKDKPVTTLLTLKSLEQELPPDRFMRVHRSFIVALDKIEAVERGQLIIGGDRITVAEQYKAKFQEFLGDRSFN